MKNNVGLLEVKLVFGSALVVLSKVQYLSVLPLLSLEGAAFGTGKTKIDRLLYVKMCCKKPSKRESRIQYL